MNHAMSASWSDGCPRGSPARERQSVPWSTAQRVPPGARDPRDVAPEVEEHRGLGAELRDRGERGARVGPEQLARRCAGARSRRPAGTRSAPAPAPGGSLRPPIRVTSANDSRAASPQTAPRAPISVAPHGTAPPRPHGPAGLAARARHHDLEPRHRRARGHRAAARLRRRGRHADRHVRLVRRRRRRGAARRAARTTWSRATRSSCAPRPASGAPAAAASSTPPAAALLASLDASLRRLRTDHVDLFLVQTPDPRTPLDETVSALRLAVTSGRARYVGLSNHAGLAGGPRGEPARGRGRPRRGPGRVLAAAAWDRARGGARGGRARRRRPRLVARWAAGC